MKQNNESKGQVDIELDVLEVFFLECAQNTVRFH